jgi:hypothetical protein
MKPPLTNTRLLGTGYGFTASSACEVARRVLSGDFKPGFQVRSSAASLESMPTRSWCLSRLSVVRTKRSFRLVLMLFVAFYVSSGEEPFPDSRAIPSLKFVLFVLADSGFGFRPESRFEHTWGGSRIARPPIDFLTLVGRAGHLRESRCQTAKM